MLVFPVDCSLGTLAAQTAVSPEADTMFGGGEGSAAGWQVVGPATGAITVQRSARIGLWTYNRTTDKLSSLSRLHPDDLHGLSLETLRHY